MNRSPSSSHSVIPDILNRGIQVYFMQGFAPADEILLFRQKDPKPFSPVHGPSNLAQKQVLRGASASAPNKMAQKLAALKQPSPER